MVENCHVKKKLILSCCHSLLMDLGQDHQQHPTVNSGGASMARVRGCGCWCKWHVSGDMWQVTPDTWHLTPDMWHVTPFLSFLLSAHVVRLISSVCGIFSLVAAMSVSDWMSNVVTSQCNLFWGLSLAMRSHDQFPGLSLVHPLPPQSFKMSRTHGRVSKLHFADCAHNLDLYV